MKNLKGLEEYRRKVKSGEIQRALTPIEKSFKYPRSLRYAINGKCFDCSCGQAIEITKCPITKCTLHRFRPYQKKEKL